ncbi:MAG: hypothetical protein ACRCSF_04740 [Mycobacteriaceae bacterium]
MINFDLEKELQEIESAEAAQTDLPSEKPSDSKVSTTSAITPEKFLNKNFRLITRICSVIVILTLISSACWLSYQQKQNNALETSREDVATISASGAVAVLSYSAATIDADLAKARTLLTGDFLDYYSRFGTEYVAPAAKERSINSTVAVTGTSLVSVEKNHAVTLVYVTQTTSSQDSPNPNTTSSSLRIELERHDGNWLISKFEPI